jgi:hypothetical protein
MLMLTSKTIDVDGITVYPDHDDPDQFWYLPTPVALARRGVDNRAAFTYIKYKPAAVSGGAKGGGFLMFESALHVDEQTKNKIRAKLSSLSKKPQLAAVSFDEGTVECIALNVQGSGGTVAGQPPDGGFNAVEKILGASVPSLHGDNSAAFSLTLSQEGAIILEESFRKGTTPVGVLYKLKFTGIRPSLSVKISADMKRVYDQFSVGLSASYYFVQVGIEAGFEKLMQDQAIKIEVVNASTAADRMDKEKEALKFFQDTFLRDFFTPSLHPGQLSGGGAGTPPTGGGGTPPIGGGTPPIGGGGTPPIGGGGTPPIGGGGTHPIGGGNPPTGIGGPSGVGGGLGPTMPHAEVRAGAGISPLDAPGPIGPSGPVGPPIGGGGTPPIGGGAPPIGGGGTPPIGGGGAPPIGGGGTPPIGGGGAPPIGGGGAPPIGGGGTPPRGGGGTPPIGGGGTPPIGGGGAPPIGGGGTPPIGGGGGTPPIGGGGTPPIGGGGAPPIGGGGAPPIGGGGAPPIGGGGAPPIGGGGTHPVGGGGTPPTGGGGTPPIGGGGTPPVGGGGGTHPTGGGTPPGGAAGGSNAAISLKLKFVHQEELKTVHYEYTSAEAAQQMYNPQGFFGLLVADLDRGDYFVEVDLDSPFFRVFSIAIDAPIDFAKIGMHSAELAVDYGDPSDPANNKHKDFVFDPAHAGTQKFEVFMNKKLDNEATHQVQFHFDPSSGWDGEKFSYEFPPKKTEDRTLYINPFEYLGFMEISVMPHRIDKGMVEFTEVRLAYKGASGWTANKTITVTPDSPAQIWKLRLSDTTARTYTYTATHHLKDGTTRVSPPVTSREIGIMVDDPFDDAIDIIFIPLFTASLVRKVFIDVEYADPDNNYKRAEQLEIPGTQTQETKLRIALMDKTKNKFRYRFTFVSTGNKMNRGPWVETIEPLVGIVDPPPQT